MAVPKEPSITPLMEEVERIIRRHAVASLPMPTNPVLGELAGGRGRSSVSRAVQRLIVIGRLVVESDEKIRRAVFPDGIKTGWGKTCKGHAPYCSRPRGTVVVVPEPPVVIRLHAPIIERVKIKPSLECQMPMWGDGEKPTHIYCGKPCVPGTSWCADHKKGMRL